MLSPRVGAVVGRVVGARIVGIAVAACRRPPRRPSVSLPGPPVSVSPPSSAAGPPAPPRLSSPVPPSIVSAPGAAAHRVVAVLAGDASRRRPGRRRSCRSRGRRGHRRRPCRSEMLSLSGTTVDLVVAVGRRDRVVAGAGEDDHLRLELDDGRGRSSCPSAALAAAEERVGVVAVVERSDPWVDAAGDDRRRAAVDGRVGRNSSSLMPKAEMAKRVFPVCRSIRNRTPPSAGR